MFRATYSCRRFAAQTSVALLSVLLCCVSGYGQIPEDLPEAAEAAWEAGLDGFRQGDWDKAIRNLVVVQAAAPTNPAILYNLALSYDFVGFRELLAIGWLNTYIAAAPRAPNVGQTQVRLEDLDNVAVGRLTELFEKAKLATDPLGAAQDPTDRITAYDRIAQAQARSRVMAIEALATADEIESLCVPCQEGRPEEERTGVLRRILEAQIEAGDLDDAFRTASAIDKDPATRDDAFGAVALAWAGRGNGERSDAAVGQIADSVRREAADSAAREALALPVDEASGNDDRSELDRWAGFMREYAVSLAEVSGVFPDGAGETEPLAVVDTLIEAASAYGQELARLREMQNIP